jgi:hypothetical protein
VGADTITSSSGSATINCVFVKAFAIIATHPAENEHFRNSSLVRVVVLRVPFHQCAVAPAKSACKVECSTFRLPE